MWLINWIPRLLFMHFTDALYAAFLGDSLCCPVKFWFHRLTLHVPRGLKRHCIHQEPFLRQKGRTQASELAKFIHQKAQSEITFDSLPFREMLVCLHIHLNISTDKNLSSELTNYAEKKSLYISGFIMPVHYILRFLALTDRQTTNVVIWKSRQLEGSIAPNTYIDNVYAFFRAYMSYQFFIYSVHRAKQLEHCLAMGSHDGPAD